MSELKAYTPKELVMQGRHNEPIYLKSEADKVISDLEESHKMEAEQLLIEIAELIKKNERLANKDKIMASETIKEVLQEINHQKYKRCLAMAKWCIAEAKVSDDEYRMYWWVEWHKRWLKIAEEFKEAK